ncbi:MAG: GNAT family protein [Pseudomonadota bacterium]
MINLRAFNIGDVSRLVELANNKNVSRYLTGTFPFPYSREDAEWWINTGSKQGVNKVIEYENHLVGSVGYSQKSADSLTTAIIGYWVGEPYWGLGIASAALKTLTTEVFATTNIVRLEAGIYSPNIGSMRVAENAGYVREAILQKAIYKDGEYYDEYIYAKIAADLA